MIGDQFVPLIKRTRVYYNSLTEYWAWQIVYEGGGGKGGDFFDSEIAALLDLNATLRRDLAALKGRVDEC